MLNDEICESISLKYAKGSCYNNHCFNIDDMETTLKNLKQNKVDGLANYCSNHILLGSKRLHTLLLLLCNCIVHHGIVPKQFLSSVIIPTPQNKRKSLNDLFFKMRQIFSLTYPANFRSLPITPFALEGKQNCLLKVKK